MGQAKRRKEILGDNYGKEHEAIIDVSEIVSFEDVEGVLKDIEAPAKTVDELNKRKHDDIFCFWKIESKRFSIGGVGTVKFVNNIKDNADINVFVMASTPIPKGDTESIMEKHKAQLFELILAKVTAISF